MILELLQILLIELMLCMVDKLVERGTIEDIFYNPKHPYTWGLIKVSS